MIPKDLSAITEADLQALIDDEVREGTSIEYKQSIDLDNPDSRRKLLQTVCSFANTNGGDLLIGVEADPNDNALPANLTGITTTNLDAEILRFDDVIRKGLDERVTSFHIQPVALSSGFSVLVIRIPQSWRRPHRLTKERHFYGRTSAGTTRLEIAEVRRAFVLSEAQSDRIRDLVADRLMAVQAENTPVPLQGTARTILHLIPASASDSASELIPVETMRAEYDQGHLTPAPGRGSMSFRLSLDGFSVYTPGGPDDQVSLVSLYRNGMIEAVDAYLLDDGRFPASAFEKQWLQILPKYLQILNRNGIPLPVYLFLSLVGVEGSEITLPSHDPAIRAHLHPIDRAVLTLPEVVIRDYNADPLQVMRPLFDRIWNACGWPKSPNFDDAGNWNRGDLSLD